MKPLRWLGWGILVLLLPTASLWAGSAGIEQVISVSSGPAVAGEVVDVAVMWLNHGVQTARITVPSRISGTLVGDAGEVDVLLVRTNPDRPNESSIAPGGFYRAVYRLNIDPKTEGFFALRIEGGGAAALTVASPAPAPEPGQVEKRKPLPEAYFAGNFYGYEPMYFLYGFEPQDARFQFSLKYRILNTAGPLASKWSALRGIFFGYTQTSLWDLESASKPFEDTSYKPELFYLRQDLPFSPGSGIRRVGVQTGIQHESNGRAGDESRSLNIAYIRPTLIFGDPEGYHLTVSPKVWCYIGDLSENPDIYRYRGYFDFHLDYGSRDGWKIASIWRKGTEGSNGSVQLDLTYPLNRICFRNLDFFLQAQFFTGNGETLLHYDRYDTRFRLGLGVYR